MSFLGNPARTGRIGARALQVFSRWAPRGHDVLTVGANRRLVVSPSWRPMIRHCSQGSHCHFQRVLRHDCLRFWISEAARTALKRSSSANPCDQLILLRPHSARSRPRQRSPAETGPPLPTIAGSRLFRCLTHSAIVERECPRPDGSDRRRDGGMGAVRLMRDPPVTRRICLQLRFDATCARLSTVKWYGKSSPGGEPHVEQA
jgi:hypothetical protein